MNELAAHSDEVLLKLMSNDNQIAFSTIYRRYWKDLFETAAKVLRGRQEAEDVVQDIFLSLWNRRKKLDVRGSLVAYLQTSVKYKSINYIEKDISRRDYLDVLNEVSGGLLTASPSNELEFKELQQTIQEALLTMPPKMQEVYRLSRQEHLSHREISEKLGISVETVRKHIQHALQLIRTSLGRSTLKISIFLLYTMF